MQAQKNNTKNVVTFSQVTSYLALKFRYMGN